jgi:hypothetical protein
MRIQEPSYLRTADVFIRSFGSYVKLGKLRRLWYRLAKGTVDGAAELVHRLEADYQRVCQTLATEVANA